MRLIVTLSAIVVTLAACKPTTELPIEGREITLAGSPQQVICRVEAGARHSGLSFHYGHNQMNDIISFRLIGRGYEIEAANFTGTATYDFRLYDRSKDDVARLSAKRVFSTLIEDLKRSSAASCPLDR